MDAMNWQQVGGPGQIPHDLEPVEGAPAGQQPEASMAPGAEASVQAWGAHESDAISAAMRESLLGATGVMPDDPMTLKEFYQLSSPILQALDQALERASGALDGAVATGACKQSSGLAGAAGEKLLSALTELAAGLANDPPDHHAVKKLANQADASFLDFASGGDPARRDEMAASYGSSAAGGGAFGNALAARLGAHWAATAGVPHLPAQMMPPPPAAPPSPVAQQGAPSAAPAPAVAQQSVPSAPVGQQSAPPAAPSRPPAAAPPSPVAQQGASSGAPAAAPRALSASHASPTSPAKPAGYGLLDAARSGQLLREGAKGPEVAALQRALNAAGASPRLSEDGAFGPKTFAAVEQFQGAHGCAVDGVVGPKSMKALDAALGQPSGGGSTQRQPGAGGAQGSGGAGGAGGVTPPGGAQGPRAAVKIAESQIGVREATGNNDGIPAQRYSGGRKEPWCANFISWAFRRAGDPLPGNQVAIGNVNEMARQLANKGDVYRPGAKRPEPGDIVFFGSYPGGLSHVGLVDRVSADGKTLQTVEGNAGNRVASMARSIGEIGVLARPG